MIGRRLGNSWKSGIGGNDENTLLLLHGEDFTDSSLIPKTVMNSGITISDIGRFDNCIYMDSSGEDGLIITPSITIPDEWTIDFWVKVVSEGGYKTTPLMSSNGENYPQRDAIYLIGYADANVNGICLLTASDNIEPNCFLGSEYRVGEWMHYAITFKNNVYTVFVNGVKNAVKNQRNFIGSWDVLFYEADAPAGQMNSSLFDEFRISNIARWTSNFTPPDQPYS